jgi:glycosyltransferase involved in cell wall biosynthesis
LEGPLWAYFRWLHNQADLNLCPSDYTLDELQRHGFERVCLWPHGVDTDCFSPVYRSAEWRERLSGGHPEAPLLLYVGRLAAEKRLEWLRPLLDAMPEARLAVVGDGPIRPALMQQFANTPTVFAGYLEGRDLSCAYAAADLFVFPSASETLGNVVLEAMASGLPVVAARAGGPVDLVRDGVNGYLSDAARPEQFCERVQRLVRDPNERARLAAGALRYAQSQSWTAVLDQLLGITKRSSTATRRDAAGHLARCRPSLTGPGETPSGREAVRTEMKCRFP